MLSNPAEAVKNQIAVAPDLLLITFFRPDVREYSQNLFVSKTFVINDEEFELNEDDLIAIGARLELALGEELIKVQLEWRAFGRAAARLLGREDEFDA